MILPTLQIHQYYRILPSFPSIKELTLDTRWFDLFAILMYLPRDRLTHPHHQHIYSLFEETSISLSPRPRKSNSLLIRSCDWYSLTYRLCQLIAMTPVEIKFSKRPVTRPHEKATDDCGSVVGRLSLVWWFDDDVLIK